MNASGLGNAGSISAIVAAAIAVLSVLVVVVRWWRSKHAPWDMYFMFQGKKCRRLTIYLKDRPYEEDLQVWMKLRQSTTPVAIRLADNPLIMGQQLPYLAMKLIRLVLWWKHIRRRNASEDCGLQIPRIKNETWTAHSQLSNPDAIPGDTPGRSKGIMWNLCWGDRPPVSANNEIKLTLTIRPTKTWKGEIEFSGEVDRELHRMQRRVEVKRSRNI